jgi:heptosyltransferase-3
MRILIARTDSIGDVMLTLPMAYYLKKLFPSSCVFFLGKSYTKDIIERCLWVDEFLNADNAYLLEDQVRWLQQLKLDLVIFALPEPRWMCRCAKANCDRSSVFFLEVGQSKADVWSEEFAFA